MNLGRSQDNLNMALVPSSASRAFPAMLINGVQNNGVFKQTKGRFITEGGVILNLDPELIYDSSTFRDGEISRFQINFQNINEDDYDYTITWSLTGEVTEDFTFVNRNFFEYNWIRSGTYNLYYDIAIPLMNTEYSNLLSPVVILESTFYFSIPGKV